MSNINNGHATEGIDKVVGSNESRLKPRKTNPFRWTVGLIVRLCIWYALLTPFFRCPSDPSELNESSPRVCKPYLVARSYIEPHVTPYYETYGAPYVDIARPYAQVFSEKIYRPAANVAQQGYDKYGAPALNQAQGYGQRQWDSQVVPRLQSAQDSATGLYNSQVAPHVQQVETILSPYYKKVNFVMVSVYGDYILPFIAQSSPFIGKTYTSGQEMLTTTVMPYAQSTWSSVIYFANSSLWPKITGLYSQNVEPQLVKIGQRLASYREGKRLREVVDDIDSTTNEPAPTTLTLSPSASTVSSSTVVVSSTPTPLSPTQLAEQTREKIATDLRTWQEKFAVAADKGFEDLEERIIAIVDSYISSGAKSHAESLITALESVVEHELSTTKHRINELAESLPAEDAPQEEETTQGEFSKEIRQAAISIRDRAHALREWHNSFDEELVRRVSDAVNSTLDVLDSVRDLGLQEIGMRWAWMEGVTYKDWAKYHALKAQFEDWRGQFRDVGMHHVKLEEARSTSDDILSRGMDAAEAAAKELARLKEVGRWKITAREASENFDTRSSPPPAPPKPSPASEDTAEETLDAHTVNQDSSFEQRETEAFASEAAVDDEPKKDEGLGMDDAPLAEDENQGSQHYNEETQSTDSAAQSSNDEDAGVTGTSEPIHEAEDVAARLAWGVAAAEIASGKDALSQEHSSEESRTANENDAETTTQSSEEDAVKTTDEKTTSQKSDTSEDQPKPHYAAVEGLVSELLAGKDSSFAEDMMKKLHAIYGTDFPAPASTPLASTTDTPAVEEIVESASEQFQSAMTADSEEAASATATAVEEAISSAVADEAEDAPHGEDL